MSVTQWLLTDVLAGPVVHATCSPISSLSLTHFVTISPKHHSMTLVFAGPRECGNDRYGDQYPDIDTRVIRKIMVAAAP